MTDFVQTGSSKSAVRNLAAPIANIAAFDAVVSSVLTENPFDCTDYTSMGVTISGVIRNKQRYTAKVVYENDDAKTVGNLSLTAPDMTAFSQTIDRIHTDATLADFMGGTALHDASNDSYYCQLKCHDANGELYYVTFTRTTVRISSYESDSILAKVETWADSVTALA